MISSVGYQGPVWPKQGVRVSNLKLNLPPPVTEQNPHQHRDSAEHKINDCHRSALRDNPLDSAEAAAITALCTRLVSDSAVRSALGGDNELHGPGSEQSEKK